ncbi:hypothetical protein R1sor_014438 [Riccia sorocarpa]|uniref:Malonyl-CoA decarboxylase n=1 Tax=Riccia sorocarpa TaxID=122646 RepID=A0ABD3HFH9_9MARC
MQGAKKIDPEVDRLFTQQMPPTCACKASRILPCGDPTVETSLPLSDSTRRILEKMQDVIGDVIQMKMNQLPDLTLATFREEYLKLDSESRQMALLLLATQFGVNAGVSLENLVTSHSEDKCDALENVRCRTEHDFFLCTPCLFTARLFEQINGEPWGLKFLLQLRTDVIAAIKEKNLSALHALDAELKGMFERLLVPACLQVKQITWENSAPLLEMIVAKEILHSIRNMDDLKRRLSAGRRCYGYFHPAVPGPLYWNLIPGMSKSVEAPAHTSWPCAAPYTAPPLYLLDTHSLLPAGLLEEQAYPRGCEPVTFCELALSNKLEGSIQSILYDEPPIAEEAATTAIFYAIAHTQTGLAGIEIGDSLIKTVIRVLRQDNPRIQTFCTLSPVLGFSQWLLPELESQIRFAQVDSESSRESDGVPASKENLLLPEEQDILVKACSEFSIGGESRSGLQIMRELLSSPGHEWAKSANVAVALRAPLMRLCARYLILEKKDGRALEFITNFHVLNGASVERLNWMGDTSHKALEQSAGMMVNYMYRLENLDTNTQLYLNKGIISVSPAIEEYLHGLVYSEKQEM